MIGTPANAVLPDADLAIELPEEDRFRAQELAAAFTSILDDPALDTPTTIALSGPWGSGKTSLANLITRDLASDVVSRGHHTMYYDAWQNDLGDIGAAPLIRSVAQALDQAAPMSMSSRLPYRLLGWKQLSWKFLLKMAKYAIIFAVIWFITLIALLPPDWPLKLIPGLDSTTRVTLAITLVTALAAAASGGLPVLAGYMRNRERLASHRDLSSLQVELDALAHEALNPDSSRLFVVVDNLDRCRGSTSLSILEAINKVLNIHGIVVILPVDIAILHLQIRARLQQEYSLSAEDATRQAQLYLEKIIGFQFDLPTKSPVAINTAFGTPTNAGDSGQGRQKGKRESSWRTWRHLIVLPLREAWDPRAIGWRSERAGLASNWNEYKRNLLYRIIGVVLLLTIYAPVSMARAVWLLSYGLYPWRERSQDVERDAIPKPPGLARGIFVAMWVIHLLLLWSAVGGVIQAPVVISLDVMALVFGGLAMFGVTSDEFRAVRKRDEAIRKQAFEAGQKVALDGQGAQGNVPVDLATPRVTPDLIAQAFQAGWFREHSAQLASSEDEERLIAFLKPTPRQILRFRNRARFTKLMLRNRQTDELPKITDAEMTKWSVLEERWPQHATTIRENPATLLGWEQEPPQTEDLMILRFLREEPLLSPRIGRIVTLDDGDFHGVAP